MPKKILWVALSSLMLLSLVMAACSPAATTTTPAAPAATTAPTSPTTAATPTSSPPVAQPSQQPPVSAPAQAPQYGGTLRMLTSDPTSTSAAVVGGSIGTIYTNQYLWAGDWAKGPAGGFGTKETDWGSNWYDIWDMKAGFIAQSWKWSIDSSNNATLVYQIRQGIHWALNPNSDASRLVNGRQLTADDVLFNLNSSITDPQNTIYRSNPELRVANITKTGPWEITVKLPVSALANAILRFGNAVSIMPPEVAQKYGNMSDWKNSVGTGPFMLTDYTPGSSQKFVRNSNFWMQDPVGPGKGNQLPYLDGIQLIIIPDSSTQLAAMRTAKIDALSTLTGTNNDDLTQLRSTSPALLYAARESTAQTGTPLVTAMRSDKAPFNDIRVRQALNMATDYNAINQGLYAGTGSFPTWPFHNAKGYETLWISMDAPDMPAPVKDLFTYNPDQAKALLKAAGYPNGFKTTVITTSTYADYYSIIKDMWAKVGVTLTLDLKDAGVESSIISNGSYDAMINVAKPPDSIFYVGNSLQGTVGNASNNGAFISDPFIDASLVKIRQAVVTTGLNDAMTQMRELEKYVLAQAYVIQSIRTPVYNVWWPWVKNYSGEYSIGYGSANLWTQFVWIDQGLKTSMGY